MFRALVLSLRQLGDPVFIAVLAKSLASTLLIFVLIGVASFFAVSGVFLWLGWLDGYWNDALTRVAFAVIIGLGSLLVLFRGVAIAVIGLFADQIVAAVERKHYPDKAAAAMQAPLSDQLHVGLASIGRALGWNLLALPIYLLLLLTGIGTVIAFFFVNTLLLARDLGDMIAVRHVPRAGRRDWLRSTRGKRMRIGVVAAGLFVIPVVNLLAPILAAAMAAHMLHAEDETGGDSKNA